MTKLEFMKQASKAAGLQYDLYEKFPNYVCSEVRLSTNREGEKHQCYNIYTPEINHNTYADFGDFVRFMDLLLKDGVVKVRIAILKQRLENAKETRVNAVDEIHDTQRELDVLTGDGDE